jgi:hypothetical protein
MYMYLYMYMYMYYVYMYVCMYMLALLTREVYGVCGACCSAGGAAFVFI